MSLKPDFAAVPHPVSGSGATSTSFASPRLPHSLPSTAFVGLSAQSHEAEWKHQFARAVSFSRLPQDWDGEGSVPVPLRTILFLITHLNRWRATTPAPSISPGAEGDLWALWAAYDLDIEVCFRKWGDAFVMISDARHQIPEFADDDPQLAHLHDALRELCIRERRHYYRVEAASAWFKSAEAMQAVIRTSMSQSAASLGSEWHISSTGSDEDELCAAA